VIIGAASRGIFLLVNSMFRISRDGSVHIIDVDQVEGLEAEIRASKPGKYHVDEIIANRLPSGHTSRRWGVAIKFQNGSVELEPDPWPS
jgi:hypothetical protein